MADLKNENIRDTERRARGQETKNQTINKSTSSNLTDISDQQNARALSSYMAEGAKTIEIVEDAESAILQNPVKESTAAEVLPPGTILPSEEKLRQLLGKLSHISEAEGLAVREIEEKLSIAIAREEPALEASQRIKTVIPAVAGVGGAAHKSYILKEEHLAGIGETQRHAHVEPSDPHAHYIKTHAPESEPAAT